jgi:hypothetical protein
MGSGREAARSRARLCHTRKCVDRCAERQRLLRGAGRAICRSSSLSQKRTSRGRASARGRDPGQRASTSRGQPRGATRRKRWASASREGRARRAAAGNKDRFDRPSLLPVSASIQHFPSHTHTHTHTPSRRLVDLSPAPSDLLPHSHSRLRRRKSRSGTSSSHLPCPASPSRYVMPARSSLFLFAPPACQKISSVALLRPAGEIVLSVLPGPGVCLRVRFYRIGEISRPCFSWR